MVMSLRPTQHTNHGCQWHGHTCKKNHTKRKKTKYKEKFQIDRLIVNNGWNTRYDLVSTWECEKPYIQRNRR